MSRTLSVHWRRAYRRHAGSTLGAALTLVLWGVALSLGHARRLEAQTVPVLTPPANQNQEGGPVVVATLVPAEASPSPQGGVSLTPTLARGMPASVSPAPSAVATSAAYAPVLNLPAPTPPAIAEITPALPASSAAVTSPPSPDRDATFPLPWLVAALLLAGLAAFRVWWARQHGGAP